MSKETQELLNQLNLKLEAIDIDDLSRSKDEQDVKCVKLFIEKSLLVWENWAKDNAPDHFKTPRSAINVAKFGENSDDVWIGAKFILWDAADYAAKRSKLYDRDGRIFLAIDAMRAASVIRGLWIVAKNAAQAIKNK